YTSIVIYDNGIGIFRNIKQWFGLDSIDDAIAELFKGRITTDSANHSGEGIFFTSRFLDDFAVLSSGKIFTHNRYDEITADIEDIPGFENWQKKTGTAVFMRQSNISNKKVEEIIERFSDEETSEFSKTSIPIKEFFETYPVSRSQAKRLCARLNVFSEIELDFTDVTDIGQGFADELFRVFQNKNPGIKINAVNMTLSVERMYKHVKNRT
ncbi:MAG: STAS-like domain-containing protein, partial [Spirochaetales bacterium]|nr:STAS-like domain-containing protein [Spirochaetales bacterium]